jgi:hypothetical protein
VGEYRGTAFIIDPDGDRVEVQADLRGDDLEWGGELVGMGPWTAFQLSAAAHFEIHLSTRRFALFFFNNLDDESDTGESVTITGLGRAPWTY